MSITDLPLLNAILNSASTLLLLSGFYFIRRRNTPVHRRFMIAAFAVSIMFLISYLVYHANIGSVKFTAQGVVRPVYFTILITHTILAAAVPVLAVITLSRGLSKKFDRHRKIARWTLPIWLYVSVTGVVIYLMLYQLFPPAGL